MDRLQTIKYPPLKGKFKKYGDTFELVAKTKVTGCIVTEEPHRKVLCILKCSGQIWEKMKMGRLMNTIQNPHSLVYLHGAFVMANMHRRKSRSICKRSTNDNSPGRSASDDLPGNMETYETNRSNTRRNPDYSGETR